MTLDDILTKVTNTGTVEGSVITLLTDIAAQVRANAGNPAKLAAIADELDRQSAEGAAAVVANTDLATPPA